jgi:ABC-type branched-subunit amino acid transport system ATPase component
MLENGCLTPNHADPIPQVDSIDGIPVTIAAPSWFSQLVSSPEHATSELLPRGATLTRICRPDRWKPEAKPVLEIKGLIVNRGARTVIGLDEHGDPNGFDLTLHEGEIAILQAPNGWGKSTLFDALCGNAPSKSGSIVLNGSPVESTPPWVRAQTGLAASPSAAKLFPSLKVSEVARLAPHSPSTDSGSIPFAERTISSLSGGEKQRTLLRLALPDSENPQLVILDEPFAMLDDHATQQTVETIIDMHPHHAILLLLPANHSFN